MATEVDNHIVRMSLENGNFEKNAQETISTIEKLKDKLNLKNVGKGFEELESASKKVSFSGIGSAVDSISQRFTNLGIIGVTALQNITNKAINAGEAMLKSLTIAPIKQGFEEYELKMGSIQTILAGTVEKGETLETVSKYLEELNTYADKTIYSFSDMTSSIGKFTNAGVDLDKAVAAIKGISNEAAVSGANAQQASHAMYNFAQALSSGAVKLIDWKSIENANMATVEFKQQLIDTAVALGTVVKQGDKYVSTTTDLNGKVSDAFTSTSMFNDSLSSQWMTTDVLVETLGRYADETTDIGKKAFAAATEVKTFSMMIDALKEAVGSGWATTWENIFGDFNEAKELWTRINNAVSEVIDKQSDSRNNLLKTWKELGGRASIIEGLANIIKALGTAVSSVGKGFSKIFPPLLPETLAGVSKKFEAFTKNIKISDSVLKDIQETAQGFFSIFSAGLRVISPLAKAVFRLSEFILPPLIETIFSITGAIGRVMTAIDDFNKKTKIFSSIVQFIENIVGGILWPFRILFQVIRNGFDRIDNISFDSLIPAATKFTKWLENINENVDIWFKGIQTNIVNFIKGFKDIDFGPLKGFADKVKGAFVGIGTNISPHLDSIVGTVKGFVLSIGDTINSLRSTDVSGVDSFVDRIKTSFGPFTAIAEFFSKAWAWIKSTYEKYSPKIIEFVKKLFGEIGKLGNSLLEGLKTMNFGSFLEVLNTGLIGAILIKVKKLAKSIKDFKGDTGGLIDAFKEIFSGLGDTLEAFQKSVKANMVLKIAIALITLAGAILMLSSIDEDTLNSATASIIILATALTVATNGIAGLDFNRQASGLVKMGLAILLVAKAVQMLSSFEPHALANGVAAIGVSLGIMAVAYYKIAKAMSTITQNRSGVTNIFTAITDGVSKVAGIIAVASVIKSIAIAMGVLTAAIVILGSIKTDTFVRGIIPVFGLLTALGLIAGMLKNVKIKGVASTILAMAAAMTVLIIPIKAFGSMDLWSLVKGLGAVLLALALIGQIMKTYGRNTRYMEVIAKTLAKISVGLLIFSLAVKVLSSINVVVLLVDLIALSAALYLLGRSLSTFSQSGISTDVGKTFLMLAGSFAIFALGISILIPAIVALSALSFIGLGKDILIVAGSLFVLGKIGSALSKNADGIYALSKAFLVFSAAIALLSFVAPQIVENSSDISKAIGIVVQGAVSAIVNSAATIADGIMQLVVATFKIIADRIPEIAEQFFRLAEGILDQLMKYGPALAEKFILVVDAIIKAVKSAAAASDIGLADVIVMFAAVVIFIKMANEFQKIGQNAKAVLKGAATVAAAMGIIGAVFAGVALLNSTTPFERTLSIAAGMAVTAFMFGNMFKVFASVGPQAKDGMKGALAVAVAVAAIGSAFALVAFLSSLFEMGNILQLSVSIGIAAVGLGAALKFVALIPIQAAITGALGIVAFLGIMTLALTIIGGLIQFISYLGGDAATWMDNAVMVLTKIGEAIGGFLGGLVGGAMAGIVGSFINLAPKFGEAMVTLSQQISEAAAGLKAIDSDFVKSIFNLVLIMLLLTAGSVMEGLASIFGQGMDKSILKFGNMLTQLAPILVDFADQIDGIQDPSKLEAVSAACALLSEMAMGLPREGGLLQKFFGTVNMETFAAGLEKLAPALVTFAEETEGLNEDSVKGGVAAATLIGKFVDGFEGIKTGGFMQMWSGTVDYQHFSAWLPAMGKAIKSFADETEGISVDSVEAGARAGELIGGFVDNFGGIRSNGWVQMINGEVDYTKFIENVPQLGTAIMDFYTAVKDIDSKKVEAGTDAGKFIAGLAEELPITDSTFWSFFTGKQVSLEDFGTGIVSLGTGLQSFYESTKDMDDTKARIAKATLEVLVDLVNAIANGDHEALKKFGETLTTVGDLGVSAFVNGFKNSYYSLHSAVSQFLTAITDAINENTPAAQQAAAGLVLDVVAKINSGLDLYKFAGQDAADNYINAFREKAVDIRTGEIEVLQSVVDEIGAENGWAYNAYKNLGILTVAWIQNGILLSIDTIKVAIYDAFSAIADSVATLQDKYKTVGENCAIGFKQGIEENANVFQSAAENAAVFATRPLYKRLQINSPSKVTEYAGEMFDAGLARGMIKKANVISKASSTIGTHMKRSIVAAVQDASIGATEAAEKSWLEELLDIGVTPYTEHIKHLFGEGDEVITDSIEETAENTVSAANEATKQINSALSDVAYAVIRGDWGNGAERISRLTAAGYDPSEVQALVNQILYGTTSALSSSTSTISETFANTLESAASDASVTDSITDGLNISLSNLVSDNLDTSSIESALTDVDWSSLGIDVSSFDDMMPDISNLLGDGLSDTLNGLGLDNANSLLSGLTEGLSGVDTTSLLSTIKEKMGDDLFGDFLNASTEENFNLSDWVDLSDISYDLDGTLNLNPVVNMDELQNGIDLSSYTNYDLDSLTSSLDYGTTSSLLSDFASSTADYSEIISEIKNIRDDLSEFTEEVTNMVVVLDDGTLVGKILPQIDAGLGARATATSRGN